MNFGLFTAMMLFTAMILLAGCASPPQSGPKNSSNASTLSRDASECERKAALAGVGSRAKAFDDCMRASGRTLGR